MNTVAIGVGSNIQPKKNLAQAKEILSKEHCFILSSRFLQTRPIGFKKQPDFLNGAFLVKTALELEAFDLYLKTVEMRLNRVKTINKNGPRTIDLDIVVWNNRIIDLEFYTREFLKKTILEVLPDLKYE